MKLKGWITFDLILAVIVAILGNIVASYFQEKFNLLASNRFILILILFFICLISTVFITIRRYSSEKKNEYMKAAQNREINVKIDQQAKQVNGNMTGGRISQVGSNANAEIISSQKVGKVNETGNITGIEINKID